MSLLSPVRIRSLKNKIILSYILLVFPLILLSLWQFSYYRNYLREHIRLTFHIQNNQIIRNIDYHINTLDNITYLIQLSDGYQEFLRKDYAEADNPEYEKLRDQIWLKTELLSFYMLYTDMLQSIVLYFFESGMVVGKGRNVEIDAAYSPQNEEWFQKILEGDGHLVILDGHPERQADPEKRDVVSAARVARNLQGDHLGLIKINILLENLSALFEHVPVVEGSRQFLVDGGGNLLYSSDPGKNGTSWRQQEDSFSGDITITTPIVKTNWRIINTIPEDVLFRSADRIHLITSVLMIVFLGFVLVVSLKLSSSITHPVVVLDKAMHDVEKGNLFARVPAVTDDEIGYLTRRFNSMVEQVRQLLDKTVEQESRKRDAEIKALLNQINPHFIYNTLDLVRTMARFQGAENIVGVLDKFIRILRRTADSSSDLIPLKEELDFLRDYLSLLQVRYLNSFDFSISLSPEIQENKIPKFLLQPFVENAVFHGFKKRNRLYTLELEALKQEDRLTIRIKDNGCGFDASLSGTKKGLSSGHIGIDNVRQRLKLYFGEDSSLRIDSTGEGTLVGISLPAGAEGNAGG